VADIRRVFGSTASLSSSEAIFVPSALLVHISHLAQGLSEVSIAAKAMALQAIPIVHVRANDAHTALQALTIREAVAAKALPEAPHSKLHTVRQGDWLSKLAKTYYGNEFKWPVIYEANRQTIGKDPNLIRPGQQLVIPPLPSLPKR
jgi:nucleoid-associated protein YgaU